MIGRAISFAVSGQSLAQRFRRHGKRAFARRLQKIAPEAPPVRVWGYTRGGSLAASTNTFPQSTERGQDFWWDMATDRPSADFDAGLAANAGFIEHPCECLLWDLGQFEAVTMSGRWDRDLDAAADDFRHATRRCLDHWRSALAPDNPQSVPILLMPHAPHPRELQRAAPGVLRVRAIQQQLAREIPNCHDVGVISGMEMEDNIHPSQRGIAQYGAFIAEAFVAHVLPLIGDRFPDGGASAALGASLAATSSRATCSVAAA